MGTAIKTVVGRVTNATTVAETLQALTMNSGDSLTVENFVSTSWAHLEAVLYEGTLKDQVRITAPRLHDTTTGITFAPDESPAEFLMPRQTGQMLYSGMTLTVEAGAAASSTSLVGLSTYYADLGGISARLHSWGDISGIIANIKPVQVAITTNATAGEWTDTVITTTEDLLHADQDYAVLGYQTDTPVGVLGFKSRATGNERICGPGSSSTLDITEYFITMSDKHGTPHIPVFNANDKSNSYVSVAHNVASVGINVYLILAELSHTITP